MGSLGVLFDRKARYIAAAVALLLAMILPTLVSADQITSRSVALSTASADADGVTYQVKFTPVGTGSAFVVDFCQESPLVGDTCTAPVGFDASGATSATTNFTDVDSPTSNATNSVVVTRSSAWSAAAPITVDLDNIDNPTNDGTIYARILTFSSDTVADAYTSTVPGAYTDNGGVAIPITDTTSVSGAVLETLQFCAASETITANCADAGDNAPVLRLGEDQGNGVVALNPGQISEGNIYTQISTNAASGAVVSLKSGTPCGGLMRVGAAGCDIAAALNTAVTGNSATFGMKIVAGTDPSDNGVTPSGAYQINGSFYDGTNLKFNYVAGNASGVTSTYGDQILNTNGAPANNKAMTLTFGASANNTTPAGNYANDISLIATGTF